MSYVASRALAVDVGSTLLWLLAVRAAGEPVAGSEGPAKKAAKLESQLFITLQNGWRGSAEQAISQATRLVLRGAGDVTEEELDQVLASLGQRMGPGFAAAVMPKVGSTLTSSYKLGRTMFDRDEPKAKAAKFNVTDQRAVDWLERDANFWVGTAYDRQLGADIAATAKSLMLEGGLGRKAAGRELEKLLGDKVLDQSVVGRKGYFAGLAAVAATRARSFGTVEGLVHGGIERLEIVAVMDERTSDICRELNGRIIDVADAVAVRDRLLDAESPEDVKLVTPWISADLAAQGVALPSFHFQ